MGGRDEAKDHAVTLSYVMSWSVACDFDGATEHCKRQGMMEQLTSSRRESERVSARPGPQGGDLVKNARRKRGRRLVFWWERRAGKRMNLNWQRSLPVAQGRAPQQHTTCEESCALSFPFCEKRQATLEQRDLHEGRREVEEGIWGLEQIGLALVAAIGTAILR